MQRWRKNKVRIQLQIFYFTDAFFHSRSQFSSYIKQNRGKIKLTVPRCVCRLLLEKCQGPLLNTETKGVIFSVSNWFLGIRSFDTDLKRFPIYTHQDENIPQDTWRRHHGDCAGDWPPDRHSGNKGPRGGRFTDHSACRLKTCTPLVKQSQAWLFWSYACNRPLGSCVDHALCWCTGVQLALATDLTPATWRTWVLGSGLFA